MCTANFKFLITQPSFSKILGLVLAQACGCIGAILWSVSNCHHGWKLYLQFIFFAFGVYSSRINTALIAVTLLITAQKSRCFVLKSRPYMLIIGYVAPAILVLIMLVIVKAEIPEHGDKINPNFQYGTTQAFVSLVILTVSLVVTIISLIMLKSSSRNNQSQARHSDADADDDPSRYLLEDNEESIMTVPEIEDLEGPAEVPDPASQAGCSINCRARAGAGRYRCDSEVSKQ